MSEINSGYGEHFFRSLKTTQSKQENVNTSKLSPKTYNINA